MFYSPIHWDTSARGGIARLIAGVRVNTSLYAYTTYNPFVQLCKQTRTTRYTCCEFSQKKIPCQESLGCPYINSAHLASLTQFRIYLDAYVYTEKEVYQKPYQNVSRLLAFFLLFAHPKIKYMIIFSSQIYIVSNRPSNAHRNLITCYIYIVFLFSYALLESNPQTPEHHMARRLKPLLDFRI